MDIKQKCGYILYFGKARKKPEARYKKARPAQGPIHKSPSPQGAIMTIPQSVNFLH